MADFVALAATAKRLIEANGRTLTLRKRNRTPANSAQPWRGGTAQPSEGLGGASTDVIGVVLPASGSGFGQTVVTDGHLAQRFHRVALIAAGSLPDGTDLETFGEVLDGGRAWKIAHVDTLQPGDTPLLYVLGLNA